MKNKKLSLPLFATLSVILAVVAVVCVVLIGKSERSPGGNTAPDEYTRRHVFHDDVVGVYIPTAYNLAFPSKSGLSADELKSELDGILAKCEEVSINSVYFQVRPSFDAFYKSDIFPVSEWLSTDGELRLDCLEYLVEAAHEKNISVTAWVNPLRVSVSRITTEDLPDSSPAKQDYKDCTVTYDGKLYLDPAIPKARDLVCRGVREIVENYEVDGIIFDDYFYPYKVWEEDENGNSVIAAFDDGDSYEAYAKDGVSLDDFRRDNVNSLIKEVYDTVKAADTKCRFGVAPFGIWQNSNGENGGSLTSGLESYSELYCDTLAWIEGGYVDFIAPQIYWDMESRAASFKVLSEWWCEVLKGKDIDLYFSHAAYRYANDDFAPGEMTSQITFSKGLECYDGSIFYSFAAFRDDLGGICKEIKDYYS